MKMDPKRPRRPLAKYPGSKNKLAKWIVRHIPSAHDTFNESYAGMLAVLLAKERSPMEAVNDKNGEIVNLLEVARTMTAEFVHAITWTPWAYAEWEKSFEPTDNRLEQARRTYVRLWMSIQPYGSSPGFKRQMVFSRGKDGKSSMKPTAKSFMETDHIWKVADRLRGVTIERMDALDFIRKYDYDRACFYLDPTYLPGTRAQKQLYLHEMTEQDHIDLADVLNNIEGMAIISGYAHPLYDEELYKDWIRRDATVRVDGAGSAVESIWISPRTWAALEAERAAEAQAKKEKELPLFKNKKV